MKSAQEVLKPYVEKVGRHTEVVEKDNALQAMEEFASQFKPKPIDWRDITTIQQVCAMAGENPDDYVIPQDATKRQRGKILFSTLELICDVIKQGVVLDYSDEDQRKYYPWGRYAGSGVSLHDVLCDRTCSAVGARLCVDSNEKARHIWQHFNYIYQEYWLDK